MQLTSRLYVWILSSRMGSACVWFFIFGLGRSELPPCLSLNQLLCSIRRETERDCFIRLERVSTACCWLNWSGPFSRLPVSRFATFWAMLKGCQRWVGGTESSSIAQTADEKIESSMVRTWQTRDGCLPVVFVSRARRSRGRPGIRQLACEDIQGMHLNKELTFASQDETFFSLSGRSWPVCCPHSLM